MLAHYASSIHLRYVKDESSAQPWKNASVRISSAMERRIKTVADAAGVKPSELIRAAVQMSISHLERNPSLIRRMDAGIEPEVELGSLGVLAVESGDKAEIEKVAGWYQLTAKDVLHEAIELGLPAVFTRSVVRQARFNDGGKVSPEAAEAWITSRPEADAYHKEFIRAATRERGLRQILASVAAHPDGSKALQEISDQEQKLIAEGKFIPGLGYNLNNPATNLDRSDSAAGKPSGE